ncbi:uncharacterized protein [Macrobrachium rosenbergii]|uniref:uncharacterized protein n=1 Tax=Macrobrachium rosenbergii TaxID=79674 RepID=UPI0034D6F7B1
MKSPLKGGDKDSEHKIVPPGHLSGLNHSRNGPPNKPPCLICKRYGHVEADCRYKDSNQQGNNSRQPTSNRQSSSAPNSTPSSQHTTAGKSTYHRGPCRDCGASGYSSAEYPACPKHVVKPRHMNMISATASLAEPSERTHPERSLTIPTVELRVITPWSNKAHRLGVIKRIRHGVEFLLGRNILWGCPTPTPHCCLTASTSTSSATSSDRDTAFVTAVPPSAERNPPHSPARPSLQITPGTPRGLDLPGPPSALSDTNLLPVPLASTGQCQAPPILAGCSLPSVLPEPGPELVPVPDHEHDSDPPTRDPPNLTTVITAQCEPPTPDVSSSHTLPPAEDDPLDADAGSLPMTVVAAAEVGGQPVALEAGPDPAPDGTPGHSSESVSSSTPRNGLARHWRPPMKKKGQKKFT